MATRVYYDQWGNYVGGSTSDPMMIGYLQNPIIAGMAPSIESINHQIATDPNIQYLVRLWKRFLIWFLCICITIVCCIIFAMISCLPMWQRVCMHPNIVRLHMKRAKIAFVGGGLLLIPKLIAITTGFILPLTQAAYFMGFFLFPLATATILIGLGQKALTNRYRYWSHGAGFGILNLVNLIRSTPPNSVLTWVQDIGLILLAYGWVYYRVGGFTVNSVIFSTMIALLCLPYTWFCQYKYPDGSKINFR